ncbi:MAG TPA: tail fiber protein [bacterium]
MFAGNFEPWPWFFCDGRLLQIVQHTALFSILGTTYGGNGTTTFALPDLRGRFPVGIGQGPGLSPHDLGEVAGTESVALTSNQMPAHTHQLQALNAAGTTSSPAGAVQAAGRNLYAAGSPNATLSGAAVSATGGSQPHPNMPPYLGINYIICVEGIFPTRW